MVVAKVWTGHVPMEILSLDIQSEHVRKQSVQRMEDIFDWLRNKIVRCVQRGRSSSLEIFSTHFIHPLHSTYSANRSPCDACLMTSTEVLAGFDQLLACAALVIPRRCASSSPER